MKKVTASLAATMLCFGLAGPVAATYSLTYPTPVSGLSIVENDWNYFDITDLGRPDNILDVNVFVDITHTWIGDLDIYIAHQEEEGGPWKYVQLYNQDGDSRNNMTNVLFDDQAATFINDPINAPPYGSGSYKPSSNGPDADGNSNVLSFFNGDPAAGKWSLALYDNVQDETGKLNNFRLDIETGPPQNAVPLPGAVVLLGSGLGALAAVRRSRKKIV